MELRPHGGHETKIFMLKSLFALSDFFVYEGKAQTIKIISFKPKTQVSALKRNIMVSKTSYVNNYLKRASSLVNSNEWDNLYKFLSKVELLTSPEGYIIINLFYV